MYANRNLSMPIVFAIAVLLFVSLACGSSPVVSTQPASTGIQGQVANTPLPSSTPILAPQPIILSGSGDSAVNVPKWDGPAVLDISYTGSHNFIVETYSSNGDPINVVVNKIGSYHGRRPIDFRSGEDTTRLEITASGQWEIQVLPLNQITQFNIPGTYSGDGDDVIAISGGTPDLLSADASSASHSFEVWGYGNSPDLLIQEWAPYSGTVNLSFDTITLEMIATGPWSLQVTIK